MTEEGKLILERINEMDTRLNERMDKLDLKGMLDQTACFDTSKGLAGIRLNILENKVKQLEETVYNKD